MVSPELSRRVAKLFPIMMAQGMTIQQRFDLAEKLDRIDKLEHLEQSYITRITLAERLLDSGMSELDVINNKSNHSIKENSILLSDTSDFIKLNYNCPASEKTGEGPGSCSNGSNTNPLKLLDSDKNYFSLAEKDAINGYTQLGYHYINDFLRGKSNDYMPVRAIKIQENLDKAFQEAATYLILSDAAQKLNTNCKAEEKVGSGPGSCSGGKVDNSNDKESILTSWEDNQSKLYSTKEINFLNTWTDHYEDINRYLHGPPPDPATMDKSKLNNNQLKAYQYRFNDYQEKLSENKENVQIMDSIMEKSVLPDDIVTYRGIRDINRLPSDILTVGKDVTLKGFTPTTIDKEWSLNFVSPVGAVLEIEVPKGTHATYMHKNKSSGEIEKELVLDRNLKYEVMDVQKTSGGKSFKDVDYKIKLRIVDSIKQNSILLDEVTSFIKLNYNCPDSEKVGSGKGSCGGSSDSKTYYNNEGLLVSEPVKLEDWEGDVWIKGHKTVGKLLEISEGKANIKWESGKRGLYDINDVKKVVESGRTSTGDFEVTLDDKSHEKVLGRISVMRKRYEKTGELSTPKQRKEFEITKNMTQEEHVNYILEQLRKESETKK